MDTLTTTGDRLNFISTAGYRALEAAGYMPGPVELDVAEPCWLYAGQITERATGARVMFTYRSAALRTDGSSLRSRALLDFTEGLVPGDTVRVVPDAMMMFGTGELAIWEAR
jgi:hypothetical protein